MLIPPATFVTLTTGVRIANFSSPHPFTFTDGSVLDACDPARARALMLETTETTTQRRHWVDIDLDFRMTEVVEEALAVLLRDNADPLLNLILVPLPVRQAIVGMQRTSEVAYINFWHAAASITRVCRVADRVTKVIHHDRFCR